MYFGPRLLEIALQTSVTVIEAVQTATPKVLAVIRIEPVSFKKYNVSPNFFSAVKVLLFGDVWKNYAAMKHFLWRKSCQISPLGWLLFCYLDFYKMPSWSLDHTLTRSKD